ncbi:MAG TPA: sodium-translocating pyrophosphatase [Kofleriaceae bacterium]|nr:sodium-translocating pyrophosphatase [Kofleriaceae bacterium]
MRKTVWSARSWLMLGSCLLVAAATFLFAPEVLGSEKDLKIPDLETVHVLGTNARVLLFAGLGVCLLGMLFGLVMYQRVRRLPVHKSMLEVSELIYETCKTYLLTQGKFILLLEAFVGAVVVFYFGYLQKMSPGDVALIVIFSLIGIGGSFSVAWFGIRINTFANSRTAFGALRGKPYPCYDIPLRAGMSIGTLLICVELIMMLAIILFLPNIAGPCFVGFAIGESLGAAALRIAGGIFTKIADIGSDLMKIVLKIKEDDARNPGVIADCTGDNAGDSVGPTADGFETYGVTGVALILFIMLAVPARVPGFEAVQPQLLTWIFVMRVLMIITSIVSYWINDLFASARYKNADKMNYEHPLTTLVWLTSLISVAVTFIASKAIIPSLHGDTTLWWKLSAIITCGTLAGALIPEFVKVFTSTSSGHVREVLTSSRKGGASLNILSGLTAGNFSVFWLATLMAALMGGAYYVSTLGFAYNAATGAGIMVYPAVFAFGLVAFGFLGMGPVTIAVDSYGPVTDNAQSVYELSVIEEIPGIREEIKRDFGFDPQFEKAKSALEEADGAGNTFKATAKPVLIGTAVVGATCLIFSIILTLMTEAGHGDHAAGAAFVMEKLSILNPLFMIGLIMGGAIIYWFTGASTQAVVTGSYRAVEFIKDHIRLEEGVKKASVEDSKKVVAICTNYAQKGMFNIFLTTFFATLAFAFFDEFFFIGYLISIAIVGLYQAIFMANAGGAWDNAKKVVETELKEKGTELHDATVVGDTVGDPFKDTSSVAMNPIIKFTTLFGLLAAEVAIKMGHQSRVALAAAFFAVALVFVWRTFYAMRIKEEAVAAPAASTENKAAARSA